MNQWCCMSTSRTRFLSLQLWPFNATSRSRARRLFNLLFRCFGLDFASTVFLHFVIPLSGCSIGCPSKNVSRRMQFMTFFSHNIYTKAPIVSRAMMDTTSYEPKAERTRSSATMAIHQSMGSPFGAGSCGSWRIPPIPRLYAEGSNFVLPSIVKFVVYGENWLDEFILV